MTLIPGTPVATPAAEVGTGSVTVHLFACPAGLPLAPWGGPADQAVLLAACEPFASPAVARSWVPQRTGSRRGGRMSLQACTTGPISRSGATSSSAHRILVSRGPPSPA